MADGLLQRFVRGVRQVVALQLIIALFAVALAGWTLGVTGELMRERESLRARVAQLEETLVSNDVVVPSAANVLETPMQRARNAYPPAAPAGAELGVVAESEASALRIISDLFTPAPAMAVVIVHVRNDAEARIAAPIAELFAQQSSLRVLISIMPPRDPRGPGYFYFDGRQSGAAAALMQSFHDIARGAEVAPWSAQVLAQARRVAPQAHWVLFNAFQVPFEEKLRFAGVDDATVALYRHQARAQAAARLQALADAAGLARGRWEPCVIEGDPSQRLVEQEQGLDCDLTIIGKHGQSAAEDLLLGSVTKHVLAEGAADVLVATRPAA